MKPITPRRTLLGGLGLVLLTGGVGSHPQSAGAETEGLVHVAAAYDPVTGVRWATFPEHAAVDLAIGAAADEGAERAKSRAYDDGDLDGDDAAGTAWEGLDGEAIDADGPLQGRSGAATALAIRDATTALALLDAEAPAAEGSAPWFVHGALRGRALRLAERDQEAVAILEPRLAHPDIDDHFPRDVLGMELARARLAWAEGLAQPQADEQRDKVVDELDHIRKIKDLRNLGELRVMQAETMAAIEGSSERSAKRQAGKAAKALAKVIGDYPNHPRIGDLRLSHARALVRGGKATEAADVLRRIAIERAGEPEAELAWADLEALASSERKVSASALTVGEQLEAAVYARGLRRVDASRAILDGLLADPDLSRGYQRQAARSRSYTAYKQRDFQACVDDLQPIVEQTYSADARSWLLRCLERGEMYDDALAIWQERIDSKRKFTRSDGLWNGIELAVRAGRYAQASRWLSEYEKDFRGHPSDRAWLRPWLAYRLGRNAEAIEGFRDLADGRGADATRARYFLGKLLVASSDPGQRAEGVTVLQQMAAADAWDYYGLMARQRLLDAEAETPPLPELPAVADEARRPTRAAAERRLSELDAEFGEAWPTLRRARQLYEAGYLEEARRELRVTTSAYVDSRYGRQPGPRSEALVSGLAWKAEWDYPRARVTSAGRKTLRDRDAAERLREGLRLLSHDLSEPYGFAKLSTSDDGPYKARWHPRAYRASVEREARLRGIDPIHMWSLMYTESRFRRHVVSPVGARGALQIMPWTARQLAERLGELAAGDPFDDDALFDIDTNAHLAGYYVSELLHKFHGQAPMAYASYNGGPSNVGRWLRAKSKEGAPLHLDTFIEEIAFTESYRYTKRVVEVSAAYAMLYEGRLPRWTNAVDPVVEDNIAF